jgi:hypothetical protein
MDVTLLFTTNSVAVKFWCTGKLPIVVAVGSDVFVVPENLLI